MIVFLLKRILLLYLIFFVPKSFSENLPFFKIKSYSEKKEFFQNDNEKVGYSLGVSLGNYVNESFERQKKMGINLDKYNILLGVQDAISGNLKLSNEEISTILQKLEKNLKNAAKIEFEKSEKENLIQGKLYMKKFSEMKGVSKTSSGLLYIIDKLGEGEEIKTKNAEITVHYKGSLINGTEFDSSYKRGKPITLMLKDVILGWQEGLKYIKKGGKIKLIIPPNLGYGSNRINEIPANSILIFDIELLDIKNI
ncbi:FKBP-type peptidyl-prolyl cis-trans isomerase [Buchnera aphidicola]|jgi:FKBP-type peptidyl-prolyl cis-trans isomerase FkpA|uniref:FKBP-type peptidyl-prolyl cis-trans isomerase FkpA n=1 Tax=Buchnera aphidicola subsp. Schizaphis graminum (strain Sg) TaxID=198804 RepID=FKBA_BUCAP|nr:FKBP-type peptidyl-prolyl cis-trans isomerase [Buchnera aphidicola]Q8K943.1 RecName: Full=FKBP-type peptidyl-prolyl cis-trans isomerase FkpA; Short=PPIase; AltName: Full=Rotamase [Buchnera aphidicola str. Sg (Schizaphis graminum)]AAM68057.1 FKBP-type peptidyl-prolyl cis-trans isomerase [Buchnera aphidicola str. Sg (Schizaphis graminum)]AWI49454.1 FKBP-type peptidyl-prolyl cis-trans isomerase [Buchnera aphidicola (Schizaphis graminum)]